VFSRQRILMLLALLATAGLAGHWWLQSEKIYHQNLSVFCQALSCRYELQLHNPGELQAIQLVWIAHQVNQDQGQIFSLINKKTIEVPDQQVFMTADSQRTISGRFRKPARTAYVVLKLREVAVH